MKKVFKIVGIVAIVVVVLVCLFCGVLFFGEKLEQQKLDNNRINNSKTLSQYIEYHGIGYSTDELDFYAEDIKCDLLKDRDILYYNEDGFDNGILILDDYTIYETAFTTDKVYSNNQQYKQIQTDIKIKRMTIFQSTPYFVSEDNKYYKLSDKKLEELDIKYMSEYEFVKRTTWLKDESIKNVITYVDENIVVIKNDGQVYTQEYKYNDGVYALISETVLLSNEDYGNIIDVVYKSINLDPEKRDEKITKVVSDKGLFYLKQTNDQQYIDTELTYELVPSDIYNKYKADIRYIDSNFIFTTDNNIIRTDMLCRDIDKEVK